MHIKFQCPACSNELEAHSTHANQHGRCTACQSKFVIPSTPDEPATIVNESATAKVEEFGEKMQKHAHRQILKLAHDAKPIAKKWLKKFSSLPGKIRQQGSKGK